MRQSNAIAALTGAALVLAAGARCTDDAGASDDEHCIYYVVGDGKGGDGSSWEAAFIDVRQAIAVASKRGRQGRPCELWVAEGTYFAYEDARVDTISLAPHVHLYGGFSAVESSRDERDWESHETILSGFDGPAERAQVFNVVTASHSAIIDGFVITGGRADDVLDDWEPVARMSGGGMFGDGASTTVRNCTFRANYGTRGGAIAIIDGDTVIDTCSFEDNEAERGGAVFVGAGNLAVSGSQFTGNRSLGWGGAVSIDQASLVLEGSHFANNVAEGSGGAVDVQRSEALVENCDFEDNSAPDGTGGALVTFDEAQLTLDGCRFTDNVAERGGAISTRSVGQVDIHACVVGHNQATGTAGGGIQMGSDGSIVDSVLHHNLAANGAGIDVRSGAEVAITNCTVVDNQGSFSGGGLFSWSSGLIVSNSIVWGNLLTDGDEGTQIFAMDEGMDVGTVVHHCDVEGGYDGAANLDVDPRFLAPQDWHLSGDSPCIDEGDDASVRSTMDLDDNPRVVGQAVDLGAYERP